MKIWSHSFKEGSAIPGDNAFAVPDPATHVRLAGNRNPHLAWEDIPAGTAMRFFTGWLAFTPGRFLLHGETRMHQRPIGDLVDALRPLRRVALVRPRTGDVATAARVVGSVVGTVVGWVVAAFFVAVTFAVAVRLAGFARDRDLGFLLMAPRR